VLMPNRGVALLGEERKRRSSDSAGTLTPHIVVKDGNKQCCWDDGALRANRRFRDERGGRCRVN